MVKASIPGSSGAVTEGSTHNTILARKNYVNFADAKCSSAVHEQYCLLLKDEMGAVDIANFNTMILRNTFDVRFPDVGSMEVFATANT